MRHNRFALGLVLSLLWCVSAAANQYDDLKAAALKRCETIDPAAYQSGLVFNPDGYRSFYLRSQCFQQTAIEFRDPALCDRVRQRRALASSSWGYSREQCEKQLRAGIAADRKILEAKKQEYLQGAIRLQAFRVERNGNGRDYDIIPSFTGTQKNSYLLRFEIVGANSGKETVLLHSSGYYLDGNNDIRIYLPVAEIRQRWPQFSPGGVYLVRGSLVLDVGSGGQSGRWSVPFIESVFPLRERSQSVEQEILF